MSEPRDDEDGQSSVYTLRTPEKNRTREAIVVLVTIALLFVLGYLLLGHPGPIRHAAGVGHAVHSEKR